MNRGVSCNRFAKQHLLVTYWVYYLIIMDGREAGVELASLSSALGEVEDEPFSTSV